MSPPRNGSNFNRGNGHKRPPHGHNSQAKRVKWEEHSSDSSPIYNQPSTSRSYDRQPKEENDVKPLFSSRERSPRLRDLQIRINAFPFNLDHAPKEVYTYELIFVMSQKLKREKEPENYKIRTNAKLLEAEDVGLGWFEAEEPGQFYHGTDMSCGPMDVVRRQKRKALLFQLFRHLINQSKEYFPGSKYVYAYDGQRILYSPEVLKMDEGMFMAQLADLPESVTQFLGLDDQKNTEINAYIKKSDEVIDLHDFGTESKPIHGIEGFLETLTWQHAFEGFDKHIVYGTRDFALNAGKKLKHCTGFKSIVGFEKKIELLPDYTSSNMILERRIHPVMRMTPKFDLFFDNSTAISLEDFAVLFFRVEVENLPATLQKEENLQKLNQVFKNAVVRTNHRDDGRQDTFMIDHLDKRNPFEIIVTEEDQETVADYLYDVYSYKVDRNDRLPCVARRFRNELAYYPLRTLVLLPNQKVASKFLSEDMRKSFQEACQNLPSDALNNIFTAMSQLNLSRASEDYNNDEEVTHVNNEYMENFKITLESNQLIQISANRVHEPQIAYQKSVKPAQDGAWAYEKGAFFVHPKKGVRKIGLVNTCEDVKEDVLGEFISKLIGWLRNKDIDLKLTKEDIFWWPDAFSDFGVMKSVKEMLAKAEKILETSAVNHMIVICNGSAEDKTHDVWKLAEVTNGLAKKDRTNFVTTQCITPTTLGSILVKSTYQDEILTSVIMKMNLKLGGTNYVLTNSNRNYMSVPHITQDRMFVGIAVLQPEKTRLNGDATYNPTVVGLSYSEGSPNFYLRGTYWYQQSPSVDLSILKKTFAEALYRFDKFHLIPKEIFVFWRSGKFQRSMEEEKIALQEVIDKRVKDVNAKSPKLFIISVNTKPKTRFFTWETKFSGNAQTQNVQAGTFVQESFLRREFTMINHKSQAGLAHPVRFTMLNDEIGEQDYAEAEIERTTNALCFLQNNSTRSTAVPAPLYSAMDLAKRGMKNYETMDAVIREEESEEERKKRETRTPEGWQKYYGNLMERHMPVPIKSSKFWA
ncbi:hypothetical protein L596_016063 [Steinernema carpocapsae]|uniref:Piwi domain-containing protein n=1 Tax=Steinernema carpocapsae TaxID=34508 RepID=A0A4U5NHW1_STECR|nr:hypothetical protein L596_016063 [Steinernema carpocapsae]